MKLLRKAAILLILLCFTTAFAQENACAGLVQQALSVVENGCDTIARNQACYGYVSLQATPQQGVQNFTFTHQGDLTDVANIATLQLSELDVIKKIWGVALMKIQANLPDTLPGQNVTFVLFGNVKIQNAVTPAATVPTLQVTSSGAVAVRSGPATTYRALGSLAKGQTTTADARSSDNLWVRIQIPNSDSQGWVSAALVKLSGDISQLSTTDTQSAESAYKPMQAFYISSGIGQPKCSQAPEDGVLIQTPEGVGKVNLRANGADINLGSTAFIQAQPNGFMTISIIEGETTITADGKTITVPAGAKVTIPMDANLMVNGRPLNVVPYDPNDVNNLPIVLLPDQITIAPPATEDQINQANLPTFSVPGAGVAGVGFDLTSLAGLPEAQFCPQMDAALAQLGTNRTDYLASLQHSLASIPAGSQGQIQALIDKLNACP